MTRGFTLLEVVVALVLLEVAVVSALGTLAVASRNLGRAERLERAVAASEGVLDSLAGVPDAVGGAVSDEEISIEWSIDADGEITLRAIGVDGSTDLEVYSALPLR
jgi:hypothetical protein